VYGERVYGFSGISLGSVSAEMDTGVPLLGILGECELGGGFKFSYLFMHEEHLMSLIPL
jgi:hypothetical protein